MMKFSRRSFLAGSAAVAASRFSFAQAPRSSPFRLAVITDEISTDFDHACYVASHDLGLQWVELRDLWGTNLSNLDTSQLAEARRILTRYDLRVTDLASPLYKTDLPGAPLSKESPKRDQFNASFSYDAQSALLVHLMDLCKLFGTDRIRCFDFWRLEDQKPYRAEINRKLAEAAEVCATKDLILLLENEMACNTGSGAEAVATLAAVPHKNLMLNWDPANSGTFAGDLPYPTDYQRLPKSRIGHVHVKNVKRVENAKQPFVWQPVGTGIVDWPAQLAALRNDGYRFGVSLETHWHGAPGKNANEVAEASTRISMKDLKAAL